MYNIFYKKYTRFFPARKERISFMKVILKQNVKGLGKEGQLIDVADGYARNFLLPKKMAVEADNTAMNEMRGKEEAQRRRVALEKQAAREAAEKVSKLTVRLYARAGADGKLFGSVTSQDIADELKKSHGMDIEKRKIVLDDPIKTFGTYMAEVKFYPEISARLTVVVAEEKDAQH